MQNHPHDIAMSWFQQADSDLASAKSSREGKRFDTACFLSQQSAEKALQAVLIFMVGARPRIHVLGKLIEELHAINPAFSQQLDEVSALDAFYTASRYPDAIGGAIPAATFKAREADAAIDRATITVEFAREQLLSAPS